MAHAQIPHLDPALGPDPEMGEMLGRDHAKVKAAFRRIVADAAKCVVRVKCNNKDVAIGTIIGPDGWIVTKASELKGKPVCIETGGALARILQHEIDHLHGTLFIDHLGMVQRQMIESQLKEIEETLEREGA